MKCLLKITALIEVGAGLALLILPALGVKFLLGEEISGVAIPLGRVAGVALLALAAACWFATHDAQSCAARGLVGGMVLYNVGVAVILAAAAIFSHTAGVALWPAVILHVGMT